MDREPKILDEATLKRYMREARKATYAQFPPFPVDHAAEDKAADALGRDLLSQGLARRELDMSLTEAERSGAALERFTRFFQVMGAPDPDALIDLSNKQIREQDLGSNT